MTGTISIPELGVRIDPGPACEGFVSNVEGVLNRIGKVLESLLSWAETGKERERIRSLQGSLEKVREGRLAATLVIEDLSGNSAIIADKVKVCRIEAIEDDIEENA